MKNVIIVADGMADNPIDELDGKTPLQVAETPGMDWIASNGKTGRLENVPEGLPTGSAVAIMSIIGYDPKEYFTGRGPIEAAGLDVDLEDDEVAFRCNLITVENDRIKDYSADHISTEESAELFETVSEKYGDMGNYYVGIDYRHLFVVSDEDNELEDVTSYAPHKHVGEKVDDLLLEPEDSDIVEKINGVVLDSPGVLSEHEVNEKRKKEGKNPANYLWVWGHGRNPAMEPFQERYGLDGAIISAVKLVEGLGVCAGMDKIDVPDVTGYHDTSYENKAEYGLSALEDHDFVLIHIESPDEAGHEGDLENKIRDIENIDKKIVKKVLDELDGERFSISVMPDHPTPVNIGDHTRDPVPIAVYSVDGEEDDVDSYDEDSVKEGSIGTIKGFNLMNEVVIEDFQLNP